MLIKYLGIIIISYLLGSLSISIHASKKFFGGDVRKKGSGNAGATNMARVFGLKAGAFTLLADMIKCAVAMFIGYLLLGENGLAAAGMACIFGHCYPVYYSFRGGKGVSSGAAVAFAVDWRIGLIVIVVFLIVVYISRKVSAGSICASLALLILTLLFGMSTPIKILVLFSVLLVIIRHKENIRRLLAGTEPDFKPGVNNKNTE